MLAVAFVVLGCGGSSAPTPAGTDSPDVTAIAALADQACACKDAPCRDRLHDRWKATPRPPRSSGDPSRMSQQEIAAEVGHDVAYHAAEMRLYNCLEPEHGASVVTARIKGFTERACACARTESACLDKVKADFDRYLEVAWLLQDDYTPADKQALSEQMRSFELCRQVGPT